MANTVQLSYTGAEINRRLAQVMKNVSDLSENFEKDREFRENFANSSYVTSSALSNYALKSELPDVSNFATKEELGKLFNNTDTAEIDSLIEVINILNEKYDAGQISYLLNDYLTEAEAANLYQPKGNYQAAGDYVTSGDLNYYATMSYVSEKINSLLNGVDTEHDTLKEIVDLLNEKQDAAAFISSLASKADKSELDEYTLKSELPEVPTKVSAFENDAKYLTEHQSLDEYALKSELPEVPTKVSAFENDAKYLTEHQSLEDYALKSELPEVPSIDGLISEEDADAKYQPKGDYQPAGEYLTSENLEGYVKTEDLPEIPSIDGLATETYVDEKISSVIDGAPEALNTLNEIATELAKKQGTAELIDVLGTKANVSDLENYQPKGKYLTSENLEGYVKTEDLPTIPSVDGLISEEAADAKYQVKGDYATKEDLNNYQPKGEYLTSENLEGYATKSELEPLAVKSAVTTEINSAIDNLHIDDKLDISYLDTLATKAELDNYQAKGEYLTSENLEGYATETYVNQKISDLIAGADENLDTLKEIADAINGKETAINEINTILGYKANEEDVYDKTTADGKFVDKAKYDELNDKYTTLFNVVYSNATGETATALNADYVANNLSNENTSVEITEGELGDVTIPETTKTMTVTAPMQDGATVTLSSPKAFNLNNTSENPAAVTIDAPAGTTIPSMNVSGNYTTLEVNNGSITGKNDATVTNIIINNDIEKNASVTGVVYNDNATITTNNLPTLSLANNNTEENNNVPSATINAENTTVTLNKSQWNELTSNVSDNTLIVKQYAHINKLIVGKGNVIVCDNDMSNRIGEVVNDTEYTVDLNRNTATTAAEVATLLTGNPGIVTLGDNFTRNRISGGILWSGNYTLDLAGHTLDLTNTNYAIMGRNTVNITIIDSVGGGKLINNSGYGLWAGDNSVFTIDVPENTEISAVTHTLYCEGSKKPHINVNSGTYKMIIEDSATDVYDANGNYKFMLNHYDSTYTREGNCFTITGGTFYGFDPSRMYGDPYTNPVTGEHYYSMIDTDLYESQVVGTFVDSRGTTMNIYKVVEK